MSPLAWIILLLVLGLGLVVLEVFVPSGGVLGLLAVLAMLTGIVLAFAEQGPAVGLAVLAGSFVAVPCVLALAFRWFPATPLGRRVLPPPPEPDDVLPDAAERRWLRGLVGRRGRTAGELVPWGSLDLDGERFDAVSEGGPIAGGAEVEIVGVQGRAVVVRSGPPRPSAAIAETTAVAPPPRLSRTLEDFDFDELRRDDGRSRPLDPPADANQS